MNSLVSLFTFTFLRDVLNVSFQRMFPLLPSSSADPLSINFYTYGLSQDIRILNPELNQISELPDYLKTSRIRLARYKPSLLACAPHVTA